MRFSNAENIRCAYIHANIFTKILVKWEIKCVYVQESRRNVACLAKCSTMKAVCL